MSELRVVSSVIRDPVPVPDSSARYPSEEEDLALGLLALALDEDGDEAGSAACAVPEVSSDQENVEPDGDGVSRSMRIRDLDRSSWEAGPVLADITHNVEEVLRRRRRVCIYIVRARVLCVVVGCWIGSDGARGLY